MDSTDLEEWAVTIINNATTFKRQVYYYIAIMLISILMMAGNHHYGSQLMMIDVAFGLIVSASLLGILDIKTCEYMARKILDR